MLLFHRHHPRQALGQMDLLRKAKPGVWSETLENITMMFSKAYPIVFFVALSLFAGYMFGKSSGISDGKSQARQEQEQRSFQEALEQAGATPGMKVKLVGGIKQAKENNVIYVLKNKSGGLRIAYAYKLGKDKYLTGYASIDQTVSGLIGRYP